MEQTKTKEENKSLPTAEEILEGYESLRVNTDYDFYEDAWTKGCVLQAMEEYAEQYRNLPNEPSIQEDEAIAKEYATGMMGLGEYNEKWDYEDQVLFNTIVKAVKYGLQKTQPQPLQEEKFRKQTVYIPIPVSSGKLPGTSTLDKLYIPVILSDGSFNRAIMYRNGDFLHSLHEGDSRVITHWLKETIIDIPEEEWISVEDRPLFKKFKDEWVATEDGMKEFIAAVPYGDVRNPDTTYWWIHHCVIEDQKGLYVVGEDGNNPAGWELEAITHWKPMPSQPKRPTTTKDKIEIKCDEERVYPNENIIGVKFEDRK